MSDDNGAFGAAEQDYYAECVVDLGRLMEEVRFSVGAAVMLLADFSERCPEEAARLVAPQDWPHSAGMPASVVALLLPYVPRTLPPSALADRLHESMGAERHLSRWFAGQLLDSSLVRQISCLDRIATLMHLAAGLPIASTRRGELRMPSFTQNFFDRSRSHFEARPEWIEFEALGKHELLEWAKAVRDGYVHRRRWPSALHGDRKVVYGWTDSAGDYQTATSDGLTAQQHVAVLVAMWNEVLNPAVRSAGALLAVD
ncbi:hypothetical protein ACPPVS_02550 [Cellulomonas sp. McL0617]|uniref:hypothetical protein n=1 Tax=Cellulomonas sp. McL0617 TaxID=3415675 RepID=UPI003CE72A93